MLKTLVKFQTRMATRQERGATAVEYGIMVAAIAAVIIVVVIALGNQVNTAFTDVRDALTELVGDGSSGE